MSQDSSDLAGLIGELAGRLADMANGVVDETRQPLVRPDTAETDSATFARMWTMADAIGLDHIDLSLLVTIAAPALDHRFAAVFSGLAGSDAASGPRLQDVFVANGLSAWDPEVRARLGETSGLCRAGIVEIDREATTFLAATGSVPERVVRWLLGDDEPDPRILPLLAPTVGVSTDAVVRSCRALSAGSWNLWVREGTGGGTSVGASALATLGAPSVVLDLRRLGPSAHLGDVLDVALREAALYGGGVVVGPVDPSRDASVLARLPERPVRPTILVSRQGWDPAWSAAIPVECPVDPLTVAERRDIWRSVLSGLDAGEAVEAEGALDDLSSLRLAPDQIRTAVLAALSAATAAGEELAVSHLRAAALAHGSNRLIHLAQRVVPEATFDDLVVGDELMAELRALPGRHRTRHLVREEWGLARGGGRGTGLTSLFAGPSGTGKTLAAEVVANALGVDLFIIDLSQIVDKYIGETEKNLERVFSEAESVNGVLLFDEADALFGKRSEVNSSHDRHANVEVAYLLQRMERYDGVAILTTNLRGNIDEAFLRRLDVVCSFVEPNVDERAELWRRHLPATVPMEADIDVEVLAEHLEISGGVIRNITLTAAHAAAVGGRAVTMSDLVTATLREYRKMGRLANLPELTRWAAKPD